MARAPLYNLLVTKALFCLLDLLIDLHKGLVEVAASLLPHGRFLLLSAENA
jgi:hypothetical protein